jgi:hypothetical protein
MELGFDRVFQVMVPKWVREKETAYILDKNKVSVPICALGGSIAQKMV